MTSRWDPNWQTRSGKGSNPRFVCAPLNFHQICFLIGEAVTSKNVVTENCLRIMDQIQNLFKLRTYGMVQKNNENSGLLSLLRVNCLNADRLQRQLLVPITQICTQKSRSNPPQALKILNQTQVLPHQDLIQHQDREVGALAIKLCTKIILLLEITESN